MNDTAAYECFHCMHRAVTWDKDFAFENCGYLGDGLVHLLHCNHCGAEIEYRIPLDNEEEKEQENERTDV